MNDLIPAARFIFWLGAFVLSLTLLGSLGRQAYIQVVQAAVEANQHPMSYGKFSRQLWSQSEKSPDHNKPSH